MSWDRVPESLASSCRKTPERAAWLRRLPETMLELQGRWNVEIGEPFDTEDATCSWVAPARMASGAGVVFKLAMPHMEADHEIAGLRFWDGDPTVRLIEADEGRGAMLLESCEPGTNLRVLPEPEQDVVLAELLRRMWRRPPKSHPFRPLSTMLSLWSHETSRAESQWQDPGLVRAGLELFIELPRSASTEVLLATDLHAGNVLRAQRRPWLVIDPKPFVGDPAYDATQHLFNGVGRLLTDPEGTIGRFSDLLGVDRERVRSWSFARAAAEPRDDWSDPSLLLLAGALAP